MAILVSSIKIFHRSNSIKDYNVIIISLDTLSAKHVSLNGYKRITTPFLDNLARRGVSFRNAFSTSHFTLPAHVSLFTGLDSFHHKMVNARSNDILPKKFETISEYFKDRGYATLWAAPMNDLHLPLKRGLKRGYDSFIPKGVTVNLEPGIRSRVNDVKKWILKNKMKPFYAFIHTYDIHDPYIVRHPYFGTFSSQYKGKVIGEYNQFYSTCKDRTYIKMHRCFFKEWEDHKRQEDLQQYISLYDEAILSVDNLLKSFFQFLEDEKILNNTIVFIVSDHGEEFMEHGRTHHHQLYNEVVKVPVILLAPNLEQKVVNENIQLIDVFPTILELLGKSVPANMDGISLVPVIKNIISKADNNRVLFAYSQMGDHVVIQDKWKYFIKTDELYNMRDDTSEKLNISDQYQNISEKLSGYLMKHIEFNSF